MKMIYCMDELEPRSVDSSFRGEAMAARGCGLIFELIDFSAVREGNAEQALRFVALSPSVETAIYRGWMLTPQQYERMYAGLLAKNVRLINSPAEYVHCHWFPNSYSIIQGYTPRTVWLPAEDGIFDLQAVMSALKVFGSSAVVVKDYVKSQKHEWFEACFIPAASDERRVKKIVERFIELQGEDLQGGLVFREFVDFEPIGEHPKSAMPLTLEYRLFVHEGAVLAVSPYWDAEYPSEPPPIDQFAEVLKRIGSHFFSCDIAKTTTGRWLIVELGDGQVAGLPERCDVNDFYRILSNKLRNDAR